MSMLETLNNALESVNDAYHIFLQKYNRNKNIVYAIIEGKEDPMFYRGAIERFIPENWNVEFIMAGNKVKVLDIHKTINWDSLPKKQIAFFIDRDLSLFVNSSQVIDENIYVTDGYSIENNVVNADVFMKVLREAYNVVDYTEQENHAMTSAFNQDLSSFQNFMIPLMSQIILWRKDNIKANLDNLNITPMIHFDAGRIRFSDQYNDESKRLEHLCACVGGALHSKEEIEAAKIEFCSKDGPVRYVRGKYLIWFLANSVANFHKNISGFLDAYRVSPKVKLSVGAANVMIVAAPRARTPQSLREFLEVTFIDYIFNFHTSDGLQAK